MLHLLLVVLCYDALSYISREQRRGCHTSYACVAIFHQHSRRGFTKDKIKEFKTARELAFEQGRPISYDLFQFICVVC